MFFSPANHKFPTDWVVGVFSFSRGLSLFDLLGNSTRVCKPELFGILVLIRLVVGMVAFFTKVFSNPKTHQKVHFFHSHISCITQKRAFFTQKQPTCTNVFLPESFVLVSQRKIVIVFFTFSLLSKTSSFH